MNGKVDHGEKWEKNSKGGEAIASSPPSNLPPTHLLELRLSFNRLFQLITITALWSAFALLF